MNKKQEQQILDYYSTTDKYIRSKTYSNAHQSVLPKKAINTNGLFWSRKASAKSR